MPLASEPPANEGLSGEPIGQHPRLNPQSLLRPAARLPAHACNAGCNHGESLSHHLANFFGDHRKLVT